MKILSIDIETFSSVDIKYSGVYKYVESDDFEILMLACKVDDQPVRIYDLTEVNLPSEIRAAILDPKVLKTAYNANFEITCLSKHLGVQLDPKDWDCTMVRAARAGWPMNLGATAKAMGLEQEKMTEGKALIMYFSTPCKPTKVNGGRTRNLPEHAPEKWSLYKSYCIQDVVVETTIRNKVIDIPVPQAEIDLWNLDQKINSKGIEIDMRVVENAIRINADYVKRLEEEAFSISKISNVNSVPQVTEWLERQGEIVTDLKKETVIELLKGDSLSPASRRILEIRQETSKTSIKKYTSMTKCVGSKSRVRGLFQFYGANRTGRWGGRLIQPQNLPKNFLLVDEKLGIDDLTLARNCVLDGDGERLELMYGNVPDTLSQLIRTAFVAGKGKQFIVADFSAIEARVIAWLAGEQWRLDVFNTHGKIYEASASTMFDVPLESISKGMENYHLRALGKIAELACVAEDQLVLTDRGEVPIQRVNTIHKVWDGQRFVRHDGVIYKGIRNVYTYQGLTATEDHLVFVKGKDEPVEFFNAITDSRTLKNGKGVTKTRYDHSFTYETDVHVYDILNCGPNNRFTVSGVLVHNCGYQGGVGALEKMGGDKMGLSKKRMKEIIVQWRKANPNIVQLWDDVQQAVYNAIKRPGVVYEVNMLEIWVNKRTLNIQLPSGRCLCYINPRLVNITYTAYRTTDPDILKKYEEDNDTPIYEYHNFKQRRKLPFLVTRASAEKNPNRTVSHITYDGLDQQTRQWKAEDTYGGKLIENCLAGDTLVLTNYGWVPIVEVSKRHLLWDGLKWVSHSGLIKKGLKETIEIDGVRLTKDHLIYTDNGWKNASQSEGLIRHEDTFFDCDKLRRFRREEINLVNPVRLRKRISNGSFRIHEGETTQLRLSEKRIDRIKEYFPRKLQTQNVSCLEIHESQVSESNLPRLEKLRRQRNKSLPSMAIRIQVLLGGHARNVRRRPNTGTKRCKRGLPQRKLFLERSGKTSQKQTGQFYDSNTLGINYGRRGLGYFRHKPNYSLLSSEKQLPESPFVRKSGRYEPVYDLINAGDLHRFLVKSSDGKPFIVHNCVQAIARDCLTHSLLELDKKGFNTVLHVHDEIVIEEINDKVSESMQQIDEIMSAEIPWAKGLPLKAESYCTPYYKKD